MMIFRVGKCVPASIMVQGGKEISSTLEMVIREDEKKKTFRFWGVKCDFLKM